MYLNTEAYEDNIYKLASAVVNKRGGIGTALKQMARHYDVNEPGVIALFLCMVCYSVNNLHGYTALQVAQTGVDRAICESTKRDEIQNKVATITRRGADYMCELIMEPWAEDTVNALVYILEVEDKVKDIFNMDYVYRRDELIIMNETSDVIHNLNSFQSLFYEFESSTFKKLKELSLLP
ncbi:TPA: hypothetical protein U6I48_004918 [Klebsiella aerogenes]|nr:hypothetical protein [Klebsiella aerogenes]